MGFGFHVARLAVAPGRERADFRVHDARHSYILEVKEKSDADAILAGYQGALDGDDVFLSSDPTGYKGAVSNVLDKAESQLSATADSQEEFRIVWLELAGLDRALQVQQTTATIYGIVQLLPLSPKGVVKECYYFNDSVAYRRPGIDASVVSDGENALLATNPFSPRYGALPSTMLYGAFADRKALLDPVAREREGQIYVADCSTPRRDAKAVREYLQRKYSVSRFIVLEPVRTAAFVAVKPRGGAGGG